MLRSSVVACSVVVLTLAASWPLQAQPYGPIQQTYALPKDAVPVYYVAPDGRRDDRHHAPQPLPHVKSYEQSPSS